MTDQDRPSADEYETAPTPPRPASDDLRAQAMTPPLITAPAPAGAPAVAADVVPSNPASSQAAEPPRPDAPDAPTGPKVIATLPPLPERHETMALSTRTGEPGRIALITVSVVLGYLSSAATAVMYARSWWLAAHQETFVDSARLLVWTDPVPGGWQSLVLVSVIAAIAALMAAAPAVISFNAWNGHRWTRIGGIVAAAVTAVGALLIHDFGWIAVGLAAVAAALLWLPPATRFFGQWPAFRHEDPAALADTSNIFYGPLPRYR